MTFTGGDSPLHQMLLAVLGAVAQFERALIRERQREGIALAKKAGVYKGRKPALTAERLITLRKRVKEKGAKKAAVAREFGIGRQTLINTWGRARKESE